MKARSQGNALLLELMIAIAFFLLAASVLLRVYGAANTQSLRAAGIARALDMAENAADTVLSAKDPEKALAGLGFARAETGYSREEEGLRLLIAWEEEETGAGILLTGEARAETGGGEALLTLPFARYKGAGS